MNARELRMTAIVGQALLRRCGGSYLCFFFIFYVFLIKMVFPGGISISSFFSILVYWLGSKYMETPVTFLAAADIKKSKATSILFRFLH